MTVNQLIEELKKMPPDSRVCLEVTDYGNGYEVYGNAESVVDANGIVYIGTLR